MGKSESLGVEADFGKAVKLRRVECGYTQEELAYRAQAARSFVSGIERGAAKASIATVWKLAQAMDCKPSELWEVAQRIYYSVEMVQPLTTFKEGLWLAESEPTDACFIWSLQMPIRSRRRSR